MTDRKTPASPAAVLHRRPGAVPHHGLLTAFGRTLPCAIGRAGISSLKREGDGATPRGSLSVLNVLWRPDHGRRPATGLSVRAIRPHDGWCDAPADRNYNRPVPLPYPASHERLWRDDAVYDIVVVLDHNISERRRGAGSAIFMHLARKGFAATEGCLALARPDLEWLLARLSPGDVISIP